MVTITIDGKKFDNEFQNMAQALAFAFQYGGCYAAKKVEIADASGAVKTQGGGSGGGKKSEQEQFDKDVESVDIASITDKPLEEMSKKELVAYAKSKNFDIKVGFFTKEAEIIALIKAAQKAVDEANSASNGADPNATGTPGN